MEDTRLILTDDFGRVCGPGDRIEKVEYLKKTGFLTRELGLIDEYMNAHAIIIDKSGNGTNIYIGLTGSMPTDKRLETYGLAYHTNKTNDIRASLKDFLKVAYDECKKTSLNITPHKDDGFVLNAIENVVSDQPIEKERGVKCVEDALRFLIGLEKKQGSVSNYRYAITLTKMIHPFPGCDRTIYCVLE